MDKNAPGQISVLYSWVIWVFGFLLPLFLAFCTGVLVGKDSWLPCVTLSVRWLSSVFDCGFSVYKLCLVSLWMLPSMFSSYRNIIWGWRGAVGLSLFCVHALPVFLAVAWPGCLGATLVGALHPKPERNTWCDVLMPGGLDIGTCLMRGKSVSSSRLWI